MIFKLMSLSNKIIYVVLGTLLSRRILELESHSREWNTWVSVGVKNHSVWNLTKLVRIRYLVKLTFHRKIAPSKMIKKCLKEIKRRKKMKNILHAFDLIWSLAKLLQLGARVRVLHVVGTTSKILIVLHGTIVLHIISTKRKKRIPNGSKALDINPIWRENIMIGSILRITTETESIHIQGNLQYPYLIWG